MTDLDIVTNSGLSVEETSPFFGGEIISEQSVSLELPMTAKNCELLEIYSPIDVRKSIRSVTAIDSNIQATDASLHLDSINFEDKKIAATLYLNEELATLLNRPIREINPDDENSIIRWDCFSFKSIFFQDFLLHLTDTRVKAYLTDIDEMLFPNGFAKVKANNTTYTGFSAFKAYQYHPSVRLQDLFDRLRQFSEDVIQLDGSRVANYNIMRVVATGKKVCPQNSVQWLYCDGSDTKWKFSEVPRSKLPIVLAGQHVANDAEGQEVSDYDAITFNRRGKVVVNRIATELSATGTIAGTCSVVLRDADGNAISSLVQVDCNLIPEHSNLVVAEVGEYFEEGYSLSVEVHGSGGTLNAKNFKVWVELLITDYSITEDDYSQELNYFSGINSFKSNVTSSMEDVVFNDHSALLFHPAYQGAFYREAGALKWGGVVPCFSYFGIYTNLQELSFGDLLFNWMCQVGQVALLSPNSLQLVDFNDSQNLITKPTLFRRGTIELLNDKLGTNNYAAYENEKRQHIITLSNDNLEEDKDIITLAVGLPNVHASRVASRNSVSHYPMYSGELTEDNDYYYPPEEASFTELAPFIALDYGDRLKFDFNTLKIKDIFKQISSPFVYNFEINGVVNTPLLDIDGFLYWVISAQKNLETKNTTIKAIKL